jgi:hypothetical protein
MGRQLITPFPADVDRDYFAAWLSGFTDGEGCFRLMGESRPHSRGPYIVPCANFTITLRSDDAKILALIQSFFGCGVLYHDTRAYSNHSPLPKSHYRVMRTLDLFTILVPHFERHPLLAKKRHDFAIWRTGLALLAEVMQRPSCFGKRGRQKKWTDNELSRFRSLAADLKAVRQYPLEAFPPGYAQTIPLARDSS